MPTYSYTCKKCGGEHDEFHPMTASPRVKCPSCGGACVKMLGTGAGIIFKGSGFYETDYKDKKGKPPEKSDTGAKSDKTETKSKDAGKKDAPAAKPAGTSKKAV